MKPQHHAALWIALAICLTGIRPVLADTASDLKAESDKVALEKDKTDLAKAQVDLQKAALTVSTGTTKMGTNAGLAEEYILSDKAIAGLSGILASDITSACDETGRKKPIYVLYSGDERASKIDLLNLETQQERLRLEFNGAKEAYSRAVKDDAFKEVHALFLPQAAAALAVLSLFKTDYELAGNKIDPDNLQLALSVAQHLRAANLTVYFASDFATSPIVQNGALATLNKELETTFTNRDQAQGLAAQAAARAKALEKSNEKVSSEYTAASGALSAFIADAKAFETSLVTVDSKGSTPLLRAAMQKALGVSTSPSCQFNVRVHHIAGSQYTKSNIFTFFGGMPFRASAEVAVSLMVWNQDGAISQAKLVSGGTGFASFDEIQPDIVIASTKKK